MTFTGKYRRIKTILIILASLAGLTSCASVEMRKDLHHVRGSLLKSTDIDGKAREIAWINTEAMRWYRCHEWEYNRRDINQPPQLGLSLSGGGIRSAAFSIGVMKGLHERGILDNVDIMSAVSGGSYALSWFYVQQFNDKEMNQCDLFGKENLSKLAAKGKMLTYAEITGTAAANLLWAPVNFIFNGLFAGNTNTTSSRAYYEHVIKRTFYSDPDRSLLSLNNAIVYAPTLKALRTFIKEKELPYFVINTTADIDTDNSYYKSRLKNAVFEFAPLRIGSDGFGYEDEFPDYTIADAVSISGAAIDSNQVPGKFNSLLASMLNIDQGYYIKNYSRDKKDPRFLKKITPFPFYYLWGEDPHRRDHKGMDIYLTDGGHSENLGAYSLVRRLSRHIIIVDGEYDKAYQFGAYHRLKDAIMSEMHAELYVKDIEDKNVDWKTKKDAVSTGTISYMPVADGGKVEYRTIDVTYIKLAINNDLFSDCKIGDDCPDARKFYEDKLVEYYLRSREDKCGQWFFRCKFPQYSTKDQSYSDKQFMAYINLGYHIVLNSEKLNRIEPEGQARKRCD